MKIPWTEEPGGLHHWGCKELGTLLSQAALHIPGPVLEPCSVTQLCPTL